MSDSRHVPSGFTQVLQIFFVDGDHLEFEGSISTQFPEEIR